MTTGERVPEKDRWWLIGISISLQLVYFVGIIRFAQHLQLAPEPLAVIWLMWLGLPWCYLSPASGKAFLRSNAKVGWWYLLAALFAFMGAFLHLAFHSGLFSL